MNFPNLILSFSLTLLILSGCAYHKPTLEYAKENKLSEEIYKGVKIVCITDKEVNFSDLDKSITIATTKVLRYNRNRICNQFKKVQAHNFYRRCISEMQSAHTFSESNLIKNGQEYNIFTQSGQYLGNWGFQKTKDKTIIFTYSSRNKEKFTGISYDIDSFVHHFVKKQKLDCDTVKKFL